MPQSSDIRPHRDVDLQETRRRFLLGREQAAQASAGRYRAIREMRHWPAPPPRSATGSGDGGNGARLRTQ